MYEYAEDETLLISGIQHFTFCKRQWALAYLEGQWNENVLTAQGHILHERAHEDASELRGGVLTVRGMRVYSLTLGMQGQCDVVEFHQDADGIPLHGREGKWRPTPIEYKRGHIKSNDADRLQVCCQALCLEEMLHCSIAVGEIFYGETRRREQFPLDAKRREHTLTIIARMHEYAKRGYTPKAQLTTSCKACSLYNMCLPQLASRSDAKGYVERTLLATAEEEK